jgi:hypothetical protein
MTPQEATRQQFYKALARLLARRARANHTDDTKASNGEVKGKP